MSNELQEFIALIGRLIVWIFKWTLNLLAICIFLVSLIAIWRTIWIIKNVLFDDGAFEWEDFRIKSVIHFGLLFIDIISFILGILSLIFITRIPHFFIIFYVTLKESFTDATYDGDDYLYTFQLRSRLCLSFFIGILDLICLIFGLVSMIMLTRTFAFFRCCYHYSDQYFDDDYSELRICWIKNFFLAFCDLLVVPHFILSIPLLTRTYHLINTFIEVYNNNTDYAFDDECLSYKVEYRLCALSNFYLGLMDIICLIFGLLSLLIPTRFPSFFRVIYKEWADYKNDDYFSSIRWCLCLNLLCALFDLFVFIHLLLFPVLFTRYYHIIKRDFDGEETLKHLKYQMDIRIWILRNVYCGIIDIFILLIGLLSFICIVRIIPFFKLFKSFYTDYKKDEYNDWRIAVIINLFLAIFDLCIAIFGIIVMISFIRAFPLIGDIKKHNKDEYIICDDYYRLNYNYKWRMDILKHFAFVWIDILFVPLFIICLLSIYNGIEIICLFKDTQKWNESRMMEIRKRILINFVLVLFDIIFMLPLLLVIIITVYRIPFMIKKIKNSWNIYFHNRSVKNKLYTNVNNNDVEGNDDDLNDNERTSMQIDGIHNKNYLSIHNDHNDNDMHEIEPAETCRIHFLLNVLIIVFVDILFMLIALLFVILTIYRVPKCIHFVKESRQKIKDLDEYDSANETYAIILEYRWFIFQHFLGILLDIPCLILSIFIFITLWRSIILYNKCKKDVNSYRDFRYHAFYQFIYLLRDIVFFIPFLMITFTLWRVPLLILGLMAKCRTPRINNDEEIHLDIKECKLELAVKGKPSLYIRAEKDKAFVLNDNLNAKCRLFVLGNAFWKNVTDSFGSAMATGAQSQLPNKLHHGESNGFDYNLCGKDADEIEIRFVLQTPKLKRSTILKHLNKFNDCDTEFVLQLEHDNHGILFILILTINDLIKCASDDNEGSIYLSPHEYNAKRNMDRVNRIRGTQYLGVIDTFYIIVGMEFIKWLIDIAHVLLCILLLCIAPWRFVQCIHLIFEHQSKWYIRQNKKAIGMISHANNIYNKLVNYIFDPLLNDLVKQHLVRDVMDTNMYYNALCDSLEEYWTEYINEFEENESSVHVNMRLSTYNAVIKDANKILNKIKPIPLTKYVVTDYFDTQNILIYLKVMQCNLNILMMQNRISWETHSILIEQLHVKQQYFKQQMDSFQNDIQTSHNELQMMTVQKKKKGKCKCCGGILSKSLTFTYKQIRYSFKKGLFDLAAIVIIILIFCTLYRIIPLMRDTISLFRFKIKSIKNEEMMNMRYGFKQIILKHVRGFITDFKLCLQLLFWSLLILISFVRIFDFITELFTASQKRGKKSLTLSLSVEIAKSEASQILSDFASLFNLVFAWKTYKFGISALIFGSFLPSAAFLEMFALLCSCIPRKIRQIASIVIWFGLFIIILYVSIANISHPNTTHFVVFSFITLGIITAFFIALFCSVKCRDFARHNDVFDRESRVTAHLCSICDAKVALISTNNSYNISCLFCEKGLNNKKEYGCTICNEYWCSHCINILRKENDLQKEVKEEEDDNPWMIKEAEIENTVATILWSYPSDDFISLHIRFNWINVIAIFAILFDFIQLISILFYMFYIQKLFNLDDAFDIDNGLHHNDNIIFKRFISISKWSLLTKFSYNGYITVSILTLIFASFWMIICSLPLVCEQLFSSFGIPNGYFIKSSLWIKTTWLYSRVFFVTLIINLLKLSQCLYNDDNNECIIICGYQYNYQYNIMSVLSFILLIFFWITSSIVLVYKNAQICWTKSDNLDIRYPLAFIHGLQLLQSFYIVFGILIIVNGNMKMGLFGCVICSYFMLFWHILYPLLSKYFINEENRIYRFSSISYSNVLQITLYFIICYIATILYLYVLQIIDSLSIINILILYGPIIILLIGIIISFIIKQITYKKRLKKLHETELKYIIKSLTNLYENSNKDGSIGNWYKLIGQSKFDSFTQNVYSSPNDLAYLLIEFERHILYERIDKNFLLNRYKWCTKLLSFDKFHEFIPQINELKTALKSPPFFTLALNALSNESELFKNAPIEICFEIMQYVIDCNNIIELSNTTLLNKNNFPKFKPESDTIISRIKTFNNISNTELINYIDTLKELQQNINIDQQEVEEESNNNHEL